MVLLECISLCVMCFLRRGVLAVKRGFPQPRRVRRNYETVSLLQCGIPRRLLRALRPESGRFPERVRLPRRASRRESTNAPQAGGRTSCVQGNHVLASASLCHTQHSRVHQGFTTPVGTTRRHAVWAHGQGKPSRQETDKVEHKQG